ncbi:MAG: heme exporter protein CcmD [Actinobacteria bacterium]|nr:heme exporter protein CcmD [Actinomycetota bacterium]
MPRFVCIYVALCVVGASSPAHADVGRRIRRPRARCSNRCASQRSRGIIVKHASFIIGSWVLTAGSVLTYAVWILRRGRALAQHATREEMPWT